MDNKNKLPQAFKKKLNVEVYKREDDIKLMIGSAFSNTGEEITESSINAAFSAITNIDLSPRPEHVIEALKQGSTGKFVKYGKGLTNYDICRWVREYMETNPPYLDFDDYWVRTRGCTIEEYCEENGFDPIKAREFQSKIYNEKK